jgi:adenine-specific DNA-methyltransferase
VTPAQIDGWLRAAGHEDVATLAFEHPRYVGARIGIYNPAGVKVGTVNRLRNVEHVLVAGPRDQVAAAVAAVRQARERVGRLSR